jgi:triacylglycerol lipase
MPARSGVLDRLWKSRRIGFHLGCAAADRPREACLSSLSPLSTSGSVSTAFTKSLRRLSALLLCLLVSAAVLVGTGTPAGAAVRNPVLLIHGLTADSTSWALFSERLKADGFTVFTVDIPNRGFGDIAANSQAVAKKVAEIKSKTGAAKVDLVGHSEGGLEARYYLKFLGGTAHVQRYISLGTPQYGTYLANFGKVLGITDLAGCVACNQMAIGSDFLATLNSGDDTPGSVRYTTVYTIYDELVQPYWNAALRNAPVTNVKIQSICPNRIVGHLGLVLDGTTYQIARAALRDQIPSTSNVNCWAL